MSNRHRNHAWVLLLPALIFWGAAENAFPAESPGAYGAKSTWSNPPTKKNRPSPESSSDDFESGRSNHAPFTPDSHNVALDVGQVFLMGNLGDRYNDNIGLGVHYTYGVSDLFGFDSSFGYSTHSDGSLSLLSLLLGLRANLSWYDRVIPHAVVGLGFYRPSYQLTATESEAPVLFGLHLGPGVDLQISNSVFFGAALTFHDMFGGNRTTTAGVRDLGGTFTTFMLRVGLSF